ncbi:MAG: acyltransferase [Clostridia bacterium]|nr:acyltransferase [Clostridia bacterium]
MKVKDSFLTQREISKIGFLSVGKNVLISRKASLYSPEQMRIGSNVRIDDFCILSGKVCIKDNVHISAGSFLYGGDDGIFIGNHVSISSRCALYSKTDDFSSGNYVGSMEMPSNRKLITAPVYLDDYSVIGTGSTLLPGAKMQKGACLGAMSLAKGELNEWSIYVGVPCYFLKKRKEII